MSDALKDDIGNPVEFIELRMGVDLTIKELADALAKAFSFGGLIDWESSKPDETSKKQLDVSQLESLGWRARLPLAEDLQITMAHFRYQLRREMVRL